jgi:PAS domain S-box-containing protein
MALGQFFFENPIPCWVYDSQTLRFLAVSKRCCEVYGYTEDEFIDRLTTNDLHPRQLLVITEDYAREDKQFKDSGIWKHQKKNGETFYVHIYSGPTRLNGRSCRFVMAIDASNEVRLYRQMREQHFDLDTFDW